MVNLYTNASLEYCYRSFRSDVHPHVTRRPAKSSSLVSGCRRSLGMLTQCEPVHPLFQLDASPDSSLHGF